MSVELIKFAFTAGEVSPTFFGRTDLEKFDLGMALAKNWFVDYRGGLSNRSGFEFVDYIFADNLPTKFVSFKFNSDIANTYVILFGHLYIRFIQNGAYVLEDAKAITNITAATPGVVTSAGHGYVTGDWIKIGGRTLRVGTTTANTFQLQDIFTNPFNTTGQTTILNATTVARIYTLVSPYPATELEGLSAHQNKDTIRLTSSLRFPRDLKRLDHDNWTLTITPFGNLRPQITGLIGTPGVAGTAGFIWGITSVGFDDTESIISGLYVETLTVNFNVTTGSYRYNWTPLPDTKYYNVYRSLIQSLASSANMGLETGYIGRAYGAEFSEVNILPDFTKTPPQHTNPFEAGQVLSISIIAGGAGYTASSLVSLTDATGSGFIGYPISSAGGAIIGVGIIDPGQNYTNPTVNFTIGAGAVATAILSPASGVFPSISAVFQQRQVYAASNENPLTVWGSKPGRLNNFDISPIVSDSDGFQFDLDSDEVTPIRHMKAMRSGLLLMTDSGVWQLTGGQNSPVTPSNALAEPHSYTGVAKVPPIAIDTDLLYLEAKLSTVRMLAYNEFSKVYSGNDVSILSSHFFPKSNPVRAWAWAEDPHKFVEAVRLDGTGLCFTIVKEQNLYAWTQFSTKGFFQDIVSIQEDATDVIYAVVSRTIEGRVTKFIERQAARDFSHVEDAFFVDCGLRLGATYPAGSVNMSGVTGSITVTCSAATFTVGDVGKIFRVGGGKGEVTQFISATQVIVNLTRDISLVRPETTPLEAQGAASGNWTLDTPVSSVTGLWHLEGQTVSVLADGSVLPAKTVVDGTINLGLEATRVIAGLGYRAVAQSLPLTTTQATIESRRKRVVGVGVRVNDSRGIKLGNKLTKLYKPKERTVEAYGEPTLLQQGFKYTLLQPTWEIDGQIYFVVDDPLPATVLGYVIDAEVGDDPE